MAFLNCFAAVFSKTRGASFVLSRKKMDGNTGLLLSFFLLLPVVPSSSIFSSNRFPIRSFILCFRLLSSLAPGCRQCSSHWLFLLLVTVLTLFIHPPPPPPLVSSSSSSSPPPPLLILLLLLLCGVLPNQGGAAPAAWPSASAVAPRLRAPSPHRHAARIPRRPPACHHHWRLRQPRVPRSCLRRLVDLTHPVVFFLFSFFLPSSSFFFLLAAPNSQRIFGRQGCA